MDRPIHLVEQGSHWSTAERAGQASAGISLPQAVLSLPDLAFDIGGGDPRRASLIYGPSASALKIAGSARPVLCKGVPCFAVVYFAADEKTRLIVARRLMHLLVDFAPASETLRLHEQANSGFNGVVVLTAAWSQRAAVQSTLLATLEQDQALLRMVLRAGMDGERGAFDSRVLEDFVRFGGGVLRHFAGPRNRRYRLSDFRLLDHVNIGVGTRFKLEFDDPEIMDFGLERFEEFVRGLATVGEPCALALIRTPSRSTDNANTDLLFGDLSFVLGAGLNKPATRLQAFAYLTMVCGLDGIDVPISESLLFEASRDDEPVRHGSRS